MYLERGFVYGVKGIKWQYVRVLLMGNFLTSLYFDESSAHC